MISVFARSNSPEVTITPTPTQTVTPTPTQTPLSLSTYFFYTNYSTDGIGFSIIPNTLSENQSICAISYSSVTRKAVDPIGVGVRLYANDGVNIVSNANTLYAPNHPYEQGDEVYFVQTDSQGYIITYESFFTCASVTPTPTTTPTPTPTSSLQNIQVMYQMNCGGYDPFVLTGGSVSFNDAQDYLCSNEMSCGLGMFRETNGDPTDPQNGDILYYNGNPIQNSQFGFFWNEDNNVTYKDTWRWITTDSSGVMTVTSFTPCPTLTPTPSPSVTATPTPTPTETQSGPKTTLNVTAVQSFTSSLTGLTLWYAIVPSGYTAPTDEYDNTLDWVEVGTYDPVGDCSSTGSSSNSLSIVITGQPFSFTYTLIHFRNGDGTLIYGIYDGLDAYCNYSTWSNVYQMKSGTQVTNNDQFVNIQFKLFNYTISTTPPPAISPTPSVTATVTPTLTPSPTPTQTSTPTLTPITNSITLSYNYSLGMGSVNWCSQTLTNLAQNTCDAVAASYQVKSYYGTSISVGTQFVGVSSYSQCWVTNSNYPTNNLWSSGNTEYIIETDNTGVVTRYESFTVCPPTPTPTPTLTITPTVTETLTPTVTPTQTITPTFTPTVTVTQSITPTQTITPTETITPTLTPTITLTPTLTSTPTPEPTPNSDLFIDLNSVSGVFRNSLGTQVFSNSGFNKWEDDSLFGNHAYATSQNTAYLNGNTSYYSNTSPAFHSGFFNNINAPFSSPIQITGLTSTQTTGYTMFYYGLIGYSYGSHQMITPRNSSGNTINGYGRLLRDGNGAFVIYVAGRLHRFNTYYLESLGGFLTVIYDGTIVDDSEKVKFYVSYHYGSNNSQYSNQRIYPISIVGSIGSSETETLNSLVIGDPSTSAHAVLMGHFKYYTVPLNFEEMRNVWSSVYIERNLPTPTPTPTPTVTQTSTPTVTPSPSPTAVAIDSNTYFSLDFSTSSNSFDENGVEINDGDYVYTVVDSNTTGQYGRISGTTIPTVSGTNRPIWNENLWQNRGGLRIFGNWGNGISLTGSTMDPYPFSYSAVFRVDQTETILSQNTGQIFGFGDQNSRSGINRDYYFGSIFLKDNAIEYGFNGGTSNTSVGFVQNLVDFSPYEVHTYQVVVNSNTVTMYIDGYSVKSSGYNNSSFSANVFEIGKAQITFAKPSIVLHEFNMRRLNTDDPVTGLPSIIGEYQEKWKTYTFNPLNWIVGFLPKYVGASGDNGIIGPLTQGNSPYLGYSTLFLSSITFAQSVPSNNSTRYIILNGTTDYMEANLLSWLPGWLSGGGTFTVAIKLSGLNKNQTIFNTENLNGDYSVFRVNTDNRLEFFIKKSGQSVSSSVIGSTVLTTGTTYVVQLSISSSGGYTISLDNQNIGLGSYSYYSTMGATQLRFGHRYNNETSTYVDYYDGFIGSMVFDRNDFNTIAKQNQVLTIKHRYPI